jgi:AraC family transcriptional regulator
VNQNFKPGYKESIRKVLHYINQNLAGNVSLEKIAAVANYSPFHFQKMFSDSLGETPKQYVIRLRLERAAHFIKIFPQLPIQEIAVTCGFSSNSVFSRAFKNYYGISAEIFRDLSSEEMQKINTRNNQAGPGEETSWITPVIDIQHKIETVKLSSQPVISTLYSFNMACIQTSLSHRENISLAFKSLLQWAQPRGLITGSTRYFGIWLDFPYITPSCKCRYLCGIDVSSEIMPSQGISFQNLSKGAYINYNLCGDMDETLDSLLALNHNYVDEMGYVISEMICYEEFMECPADKPYSEITRHLYIPIKVK